MSETVKDKTSRFGDGSNGSGSAINGINGGGSGSGNGKIVATSLKNAAILAAIAVAAVLILALCNHFLPAYVPKLDAKKVGELNALNTVGDVDVTLSGVDAATALSEGYFAMVSADDIGLEAFNKTNKREGRVLAVYRVAKGANAGVIITETESVGYGSQVMTLLTAFSADGTIVGFNSLKDGNNYILDDPAQVELLRQTFIGLKAVKVNPGSIAEINGIRASAAPSRSGISKNISVSAKMVAHIGAMPAVSEINAGGAV